MYNTNFNDLNFNDKNGNKVKNNLEYINSLQENITYSEKLSVGDVVRLKGENADVSVLYVDYVIPNVGVIDYAGKELNQSNDELILFNQKDILEKLEKDKAYGK